MAEIRMYEYYVIKFLNKTPNGILHTCVPRSWIIYCKETTIWVAFPEEVPQLTLRRIENGESKGLDWRTFKAVVLYGADNYRKGLFWMAHVDMTRYQSISGNTSAKNNTGPKLYPQPTGKPLNEQRTPIISLVDSDEDEEERPQKKMPTGRSNDPTLVVNVNLGNDRSNLSVAHPNSESHVPVHENTEKNSVTIFERKESVTETLAILSDAINHLKDEFPNMLKGIELCKSKLDEIIELTASDSNKVTETTNGDKIIKETEKDKSDADKSVSKRKKDEHLKENDEVPNKKRKGSLFDGLFERNRNLSLLTVKHTEPSPELVEIIPNSQVYIDKVNFGYYTQTASDHKTLARNLMNEIFTEQALKLCNLLPSKLNTRPALDKHAVEVILEFVELHGRCKNWSEYDRTSVINSLKIRLNNLRQKKKSEANSC